MKENEGLGREREKRREGMGAIRGRGIDIIKVYGLERKRNLEV